MINITIKEKLKEKCQTAINLLHISTKWIGTILNNAFDHFVEEPTASVNTIKNWIDNQIQHNQFD